MRMFWTHADFISTKLMAFNIYLDKPNARGFRWKIEDFIYASFRRQYSNEMSINFDRRKIFDEIGNDWFILRFGVIIGL